jgi:hypothetical protein
MARPMPSPAAVMTAILPAKRVMHTLKIRDIENDFRIMRVVAIGRTRDYPSSDWLRSLQANQQRHQVLYCH